MSAAYVDANASSDDAAVTFWSNGFLTGGTAGGSGMMSRMPAAEPAAATA